MADAADQSGVSDPAGETGVPSAPAAAGAAPGAGGGLGAPRGPALAELHRLAVAARRGDAAARAALLDRLDPLVHGAAARAAARARRLGLAGTLSREDLTQEARLMLLRLTHSYDPDAGAPLPYFTIRLRAKLNQLLSAQARRLPPGRRLEWGSEVTQAIVANVSPPDAYPGVIVPGGEGLDESLYQALAGLSPRQRRLLFLAYWRDCSDEEIGAALHIGAGAARQARYRALRALRARLPSTAAPGVPRRYAPAG